MKIEKPCAEDFSGMQKNSLGRHCSQCNKTVVDFTKMSTIEIQNHLASSTNEVCGRFKSLQLEQRSPLETFIFSIREIISKIQLKPIRVGCFALLSGLTAFTSSCMGAVQRNYEPDKHPYNPKADSLKIKQINSEKKN